MANIFDLDFNHKDLHITSKEIDDDSGDSLVIISKDGKEIKKFRWPTYKIFNIPAHIEDIAMDIEDGLRTAGSTGLGGNVYNSKGN